jgi:hypothetical protein
LTWLSTVGLSKTFSLINYANQPCFEQFLREKVLSVFWDIKLIRSSFNALRLKGSKVALNSIIKNESLGSLLSISFFGFVGLILFIMLPLSGFPPHVGLLAVTSIAAAYGLFKKRGWAIWLVAALLFVATTFSVFTLYFVVGNNLLATMGMGGYLVLSWVFTVYVFMTRKPQEE